MAIINTKRAYYQGKLVSYMKRNDYALRFKLCKIEERFLNANYRIKNTYRKCDADQLNAQIDALEEVVDNAISQLLRENPTRKITCADVNELLHSSVDNDIDEREGKDILLYDFEKYINEFNQKKLKDDAERGIEREVSVHPTTKDYISCRNALLDFEHDASRVLTLQDVTGDFIEEFIDFLANERPTEDEDDKDAHKYLTKGGLENSTINKRLACLSTFIRQYYRNEELANLVTSHKQEDTLIDIIRIYKDELIALADMPLELEWEQRVRDYFVFCCLTGLRYSDLVRIQRTNFRYENGQWKLRLFTKKTTKFAEIPLVPRATALAEKYGFNFKYYRNAPLNRELKQLFENHDLFGDGCAKTREVKKKAIVVPMLRRERLSIHAARRTFISILAESGIPICRIMGFTGHTKESTLKVYIDRFSPESADSIKPLDI